MPIKFMANMSLIEGSNIYIFSFRMLQVNIGETVYPTFTVSRVTQIFKDRDSVLRYIYLYRRFYM